MDDRYYTLFKKLRPLGAPIGLKSAILVRIRTEERSLARRNVFVAAPVLAASLAGIVWAVVSAISALSQSGFGHYISLIFSDTGSVLSLWYPFGLTIIESVPIFALTVLVGALIAFIGSASVAARNARRAFSFA